MKRIVVLGMMAKMPVPGVIWQTAALPARACGGSASSRTTSRRTRGTPSMLMQRAGDDGAGARGRASSRDVLRRFDLGDRWAYHALHDDGRCLGHERARSCARSTATRS